jgi:hypothetical protein
MARVLTIPVVPGLPKTKRHGPSDVRFVEGQRVLVKAIEYLTKSNLSGNRPAIELLSEHFRTQFRMSDSPLQESPGM